MSKDIVIIGFTNIYQMPYLNYYTEVLNNHKIRYDLIFWNRFGLDEVDNKAIENHVFNRSMEDGDSLFKKIIGFYKYRSFILSVLRKNEYKKIVVLTTLPSLLIKSFLENHPKINYIVDIRDYSYERFSIFKNIEEKIFKKAKWVAISSKGFKNFLPKIDNYVFSNNFKNEKEEVREIFKNDFYNKNKDSERINIVYIGAISYFNENKRFLNVMGNDKRFFINYVGHGPASKLIEEYCKKNNITNVSFKGRYNPVEKVKFYKQNDIIFNLYGNDSLLTLYAISNKLYDSAIYYKPILVSPSTEMEKESINNGFGFTFNLEDFEMGNKLYKWFIELDRDKFIRDSDRYVDKSIEERKEFQNKILEFFK